MTTGDRIRMLRENHNLTQEELGSLLGVQKSTVMKYEKGIVTNLKRSTIQKLANIFNISPLYILGIETTPEPPYPRPAGKRIPVLGTIACGTPILAVEDYEYDISIPDVFPSADFALVCKGDSMIDARIFDGDFVLVKRQQTFDDGDIVAANLNGEATLKKAYRVKNGIIIRPANKRYKETVLVGSDATTFSIFGVAVGFLSKIK